MIIEVVNKKHNRIGSLKIDESRNLITADVCGKIDIDDNDFDDIYDTNDRKLQIALETSPFDSLNHASCVSPLEQELSAYKELKKSFLEGRYNNCSVLINYYFGHIDYGREFSYYKTHGEICLILYTNLLFSLESGKDSFINFVNDMIGKIEWNLEHKEFLEKNWY